MKKLLNVAWKDVLIVFRDPAALIMMLLTPFALTLAMAFAFGGLGGGSSSSIRISVVIVNHDSGQFGQAMVDVFQSQDLADLIAPTIMDDDDAARTEVDKDRAAATVIIPANFSESMLSGGAPQAVLEVYKNPTRQVSSGVVRSIVDQVLSRFTAGAVAGQVVVTQLVTNGLLAPQQAIGQGTQIGERAGKQVSSASLVSLASETAEKSNGADFDWLTYMAPSMAIMFLMFTVSNGGRSILAERDWGTLPRLLTTPTRTVQIIGGKVAGIFLTGLAQMAVLTLASSLLFGVKWGSGLGVILLTVALVAAATGWGAVLAAYSRTAAQANQLGTMIALFFGMLAGNFVPRIALPSWLRTLGYVTPNAWGLEGFSSLTAGGGLSEVVTPALALAGMAAVLFIAATVAFRRQYA
jgi:linearmycin/streptolysin S transport system permease protein